VFYIVAPNTHLLTPWLRAAGLRDSDFSFTTSPQSGHINLIVDRDKDHCYLLEQPFSTILIHCPEPSTLFQDPINELFIQTAIAKAKAIGLKEPYTRFQETTKVLRTFDDLENLFAILQSQSNISLDIELYEEEISAIGFAYRSGSETYHGYSMPLMIGTESAWSPEEEEFFWTQLALLFAKPNCTWIFQNYIFDCLWLARLGLTPNGDIIDTMIMAHLWNPEAPKSLRDLARLYLFCDPWKDQKSWVATDSLFEYNAKDATRTLAIRDVLDTLLAEDSRRAFYYGHLMPLSKEVLNLCIRGLVVDHQALAEMKASLIAQVRETFFKMQAIYTPQLPPKVQHLLRKGKIRPGSKYFTKDLEGNFIACRISPTLTSIKKLGFPVYERIEKPQIFRPSSTKQVQALLKQAGIRLPRKRSKAGKEGVETTDKKALKKIQAKQGNKSALPGELLAFRSAAKLLTSYAYVKLDSDGRLHTSINLTGGKDTSEGADEKDSGGGGTVTSRFSSQATPWGTGFNIQNIPKSFRHIIIPSHPDWVLLSLDFKAADPHVVAWLSGEDKMLTAMDQPGGDLHSLTGSAIAGFNIRETEGFDADTNPFRKKGKAANNGLNYGMQPKKFAVEAGMDLTEAERIFDLYFKLYPGIKDWHKRTQAELIKTKTISTPQGRKRRFYGNYYDYYSRIKLVQEALAYVPPTVVADCVNMLWLRLVAAENVPEFNVLNQIHDALLLECHRESIPELKVLINKTISEITFPCGRYERCAFTVDIKTGPNWRDIK